jgi:hypothetical protein
MMRVEQGDEVTSVVKIMSESQAFEKAQQAVEEEKKEGDIAHADEVVKTLEEGGLEGHAKKVHGTEKPKRNKRKQSENGEEE